MSVSPLLSETTSTEPPSTLKTVAKALASPDVYGSPSWMAAILRKPSSRNANCATVRAS